MKWSEVRKVLNGKMQAKHKAGTKHDTWHVTDNYSAPIGIVLDSHGKGEVNSREIGNMARSMRTSERVFRGLVGCSISREEYLTEHFR